MFDYCICKAWKYIPDLRNSILIKQHEFKDNLFSEPLLYDGNLSIQFQATQKQTSEMSNKC